MGKHFRRTAISALLLIAATNASADPVLQGNDAFGNWRADKPGTIMPNLGLTDDQATKIVAYLELLK